MATSRVAVIGHKVLLVSRYEEKRRVSGHCESFERAGYRVSQSYSLGNAMCVAVNTRPNLIVLERSISEREQIAFIDCLHESYPDIHVLCLGPGHISTQDLLSECKSILAGHPGGEKVHTVRPAEAQVSTRSDALSSPPPSVGSNHT